MPDGGGQIVTAAHAQVVARVAGNKTGLGQARVEEQLLAQLDLGGVSDFRRLHRQDRLAGGCGPQASPPNINPNISINGLYMACSPQAYSFNNHVLYVGKSS